MLLAVSGWEFEMAERGAISGGGEEGVEAERRTPGSLYISAGRL